MRMGGGARGSYKERWVHGEGTCDSVSSLGLVEKSPVACLKASEALLGLVSGSSGARL